MRLLLGRSLLSLYIGKGSAVGILLLHFPLFCVTSSVRFISSTASISPCHRLSCSTHSFSYRLPPRHLHHNIISSPPFLKTCQFHFILLIRISCTAVLHCTLLFLILSFSIFSSACASPPPRIQSHFGISEFGTTCYLRWGL